MPSLHEGTIWNVRFLGLRHTLLGRKVCPYCQLRSGRLEYTSRLLECAALCVQGVDSMFVLQVRSGGT